MVSTPDFFCLFECLSVFEFFGRYTIQANSFFLLALLKMIFHCVLDCIVAIKNSVSLFF